MKMSSVCLLFLCILSLAACNGSGSGGSGSGSGGGGGGSLSANLIPPRGETMFPNANSTGDATVREDAPNIAATNGTTVVPLGDTALGMTEGSLKIVDLDNPNDALITFKDGSGGNVRLYDNGYLVGEMAPPPADANDPEFEKFSRAIRTVDNDSYPAGTYTEDNPLVTVDKDDGEVETFIGTNRYPAQALVAFVGNDDFSLSHTTFGAWTVLLEAEGYIYSEDGRVHGPHLSEVVYLPFAGRTDANAVKDLNPPAATYSGPALAMAYHWTGDGSTFNNAYLNGTAKLDVVAGNAASSIAFLFPGFYDFTLAADRGFDLSGKIDANRDQDDRLAALSVTPNSQGDRIWKDVEVTEWNGFEVQADFYTQNSVTEGVGTFTFKGHKPEDPVTGHEYGVGVTGAFGVK
jgi:hypothetical protein